jgi:hypothetical protein
MNYQQIKNRFDHAKDNLEIKTTLYLEMKYLLENIEKLKEIIVNENHESHVSILVKLSTLIERI